MKLTKTCPAFLFSFLIFVFLFSNFAYAQYAPCTEGQKYCADFKTAKLCLGGSWITTICKNNCTNSECVDCTAGDIECSDASSYKICATDGKWSAPITCLNGKNCERGECLGYATDECNKAGEMRCESRFSNMSQICAKDLRWHDYKNCEFGCMSSGTCRECAEQDKECTSDISWRKCLDNGSWSENYLCMSDYGCKNATCRYVGTCAEGEKKCVLNSLYVCKNKAFVWVQNCILGQDCVQSYSGATCEEPGKKCFGWSDWTPVLSKNLTENDNMGRSRECTLVNLTRWCKSANGNLDITVAEKNYTYACGDWSEICAYELNKKINFTRQEGGNCGWCGQETYVYRCMPSGRVDSSKTVQNVTCENWTACPSPAGQNKQGGQAAATGGVYKYNEVMGIAVIGVLALVAIVAVWKIYSGKKK